MTATPGSCNVKRMNTIKADGKTYMMVGGSYEKGCVIAVGPRNGGYTFIRNIHSGRWCLIAGRRTQWLASFEVVYA